MPTEQPEPAVKVFIEGTGSVIITISLLAELLGTTATEVESWLQSDNFDISAALKSSHLFHQLVEDGTIPVH